MKYLFFSIAFLGIIPLTMFFMLERKLLRLAMMLSIVIPAVFFDATAINFFSHENYTGTSRGMEVSLVYLVAFAALMAMFLLRKAGNPFPEWGSRLYLVYFLLSLPSLTQSASILYSCFELWKMLMLLLVFLEFYYYLASTKDMEIIIHSFAAVTIICFLVIVKQHYVGTPQTKGLFPHPNSLAMYMTIMALLFFSRFFNNHERGKSIYFLIVCILATASLLRSYSRGAMAIFPVGGVITIVVSMLFDFKYRKIPILVPVTALALFGFALFLPKIINRFQTASSGSGEMRKDLALAALEMIKDKPLVGVGLNNWGVKIKDPYPYNKPMREVGNTGKGIVETIYLLVMAECGIPAFLALLLWFLYYWVTTLRLLWKLRGTPYLYLPAGLLGGLTNVYLQSTLEWVLKQQMNFIQLIICFAIISFLNTHYKALRQQSLATKAQTPERRPALPVMPPAQAILDH